MRGNNTPTISFMTRNVPDPCIHATLRRRVSADESTTQKLPK
jgi:hypothetical protein